MRSITWERSDPVSATAPLEQAVALAAPPDPRRDRLAGMLDTAYLMAGSLAASGGNFAEAQGYAEKSIALMPGKERGYALKAKACHRRGDYRGAADALEKLSVLEPSEPLARQDLGDELFLAGDPDGARSSWQRALEARPGRRRGHEGGARAPALGARHGGPDQDEPRALARPSR